MAALLGLAPALAASESRAVRCHLRDGGELLQIQLDAPADTFDAVLVGCDVPPPHLQAQFAVAGGVAWRRVDGEWMPIPTIGTSGGVLARNAGVLETDALAHTSVAIVGLGSGGSLIADQLARAGVGRLVLIDRDRIEVENVGRHLCDLTDLGRRKTVAVADRLRARNPAIQIDAVDLDILSDTETFRRAVATCDVLIGATDNNASRRVVNRLAVETERPAIFGRAYTRACGGDVIRVMPGGPCYECLFSGTAGEEELSAADAPAYAAAPTTVEPGLALDIAPIAAMCARLTIQELVRGRGSALESLDADLPGSLFLWANRREGPFSAWRPMRFGLAEMAVHRWYGMRAARNPICPTCNEESFLAGLLENAGLSPSESV